MNGITRLTLFFACLLFVGTGCSRSSSQSENSEDQAAVRMLKRRSEVSGIYFSNKDPHFVRQALHDYIRFLKDARVLENAKWNYTELALASARLKLLEYHLSVTSSIDISESALFLKRAYADKEKPMGEYRKALLEVIRNADLGKVTWVNPQTLKAAEGAE